MVLAPISVGMMANHFFPKFVKSILPITPIIGVIRCVRVLCVFVCATARGQQTLRAICCFVSSCSCVSRGELLLCVNHTERTKYLFFSLIEGGGMSGKSNAKTSTFRFLGKKCGVSNAGSACPQEGTLRALYV